MVVEFLNTQLEPTNTVSAYGLALPPLLYGANYLQIFPVISFRPQFSVRIFPMLQYRDAHRNLSIFMNLKSTSVLCEIGEKWEHLGLEFKVGIHFVRARYEIGKKLEIRKSVNDSYPDHEPFMRFQIT